MERSAVEELVDTMADQIDESDKNYWHRYISFYEHEFASLDCRKILEFGVWRGASIRWLLERFPHASIHGVDIIEQQPCWPKDERVSYHAADQASIEQIGTVLQALGRDFDLIIEDGSHLPHHQRNCLVESIPYLRSGAIYVLEDIHTSHPSHPYYRKIKPWFRPLLGPLHLLLAMEHIRTLGEQIAQAELSKLSCNSLFSVDQVQMLFEAIASVKIYKRSHLPVRCFACGESRFDYARLSCECGSAIYAEADSMSAVLRIR